MIAKYFRRLIIFVAERLLEAVFFGVLWGALLMSAWISAVQAGDGGQILNFVRMIAFPMLMFHFLSWYFLSCILFGLIFRNPQPLRQGLVFMGAGAAHVVVMLLRQGAFMSAWFYLETLWGLLSVFLANYLGARLLLRWEARGAVGGGGGVL